MIKNIWDSAWRLATRMKFGTCEQNWDLYGTISGLWSQLGPSPKFGTSLWALFLLNLDYFFSETKFSETETFFQDQSFPKPKPRLFSETKFFRNRNRFFSSETKFSETETFFRDKIFSKPNLRLFFQNQIFQNRNRNPQRCGKSFETEKFRNWNVNLCLLWGWSLVLMMIIDEQWLIISDGGVFPYCGGVLVTEQHVVSAAHCFWTNENQFGTCPGRKTNLKVKSETLPV